MNPLFLVIVLIPFISRFQPVVSRTGVEMDILFFWKDKVLWVLSFWSLFLIRNSSPWVIAFWGFLFYGTLFSLDLGQSVWGMSNYAEGSITFLCYTLLFLAADSFSERLFKKATSICVVMMGVMAVIQLIYHGEFLQFPPLTYISGLTGFETHGISFPLYMTLANPNHLGLFCALLLPVYLRTKNNFITLILIMLAIGAGSRACWLAVLLTLPRKFWKPAMIVLFLSLPIIWPKLTWSTSGRTFMWKHGIKLLHLMGRGPATFLIDFPQNLITQVETGWQPGVQIDRPHNMIIQVAHATGILSLIPLGVLLWKSLKEESIYRYGAIGFLICGMFTDSMVGVTPIFCILLGLCYFRD